MLAKHAAQPSTKPDPISGGKRAAGDCECQLNADDDAPCNTYRERKQGSEQTCNGTLQASFRKNSQRQTRPVVAGLTVYVHLLSLIPA